MPYAGQAESCIVCVTLRRNRKRRGRWALAGTRKRRPSERAWTCAAVSARAREASMALVAPRELALCAAAEGSGTVAGVRREDEVLR